jgi:hypothetical protein
MAKKEHPIDIARILDYYRVSARSISALDLSRVFALFISFVPIESSQAAAHTSCRSYRVQRGAFYKSLKNFCLGITFKAAA